MNEKQNDKEYKGQGITRRKAIPIIGGLIVSGYLGVKYGLPWILNLFNSKEDKFGRPEISLENIIGLEYITPRTTNSKYFSDFPPPKNESLIYFRFNDETNREGLGVIDPNLIEEYNRLYENNKDFEGILFDAIGNQDDIAAKSYQVNGRPNMAYVLKNARFESKGRISIGELNRRWEREGEGLVKVGSP